ncbi:MAG: GDSL-type esterase/lipase family protein, partial [Acidobacteriota bacterium]
MSDRTASSPTLAKKIVLLSMSTLLSLVLLEVAFRLIGFEPIYAVYSKPDVLWRADPLLGWEHEPNATTTYVGPRPWPIEFQTEININSLGLRGPEVTDLSPGGRRVLFLGDSIVAGFEVERDDHFVTLLQKRLSGHFNQEIQVINAGVRGYGTDQSYLYFRESGKQLSSDLIVLLHSSNDARNNITLHRMHRLFGKAAFALRTDGSLEQVGLPIPDYPLCSAYRLDDNFEVVRIDSPMARMNCQVQTTIFDHSSFFTYVSLQLRRWPAIVNALYALSSPKKEQLFTEQGAEHQLTNALIRQLASEVKATGAGFMVVGKGKGIRQLDADLMTEVRIPTHSIDLTSED